MPRASRVPRPASPPASRVPRPASRSVPTQTRSRERLDRITRAAGELCAELGADAVTMDAIAARAGTSIGSLYRFYPNRDALLHALAGRYVADLVALLDAADGAPMDATLPLDSLVDAVLAPFVAFHEAHPGYFAILFAPAGSEALRQLRGHLRQKLVRRVDRLFRARARQLAPAKRRRLAITAVEAGRALLQFIEVSVPAPERRPMRDELRALLVAYLRPWLAGGRSE